MKPELKNGIWNFKTCPSWLKTKYRQAVQFNCQACKKHEDKVGTLQPHRLKRGNKGGLYTVCKLNDKRNNIKVICKECHLKIHNNEPGHGTHSY